MSTLTNLTICWSAKGGQGTTVTTAALALTSSTPTDVIDHTGDLAAALGAPEPPVAASVPADPATALDITDHVRLLRLDVEEPHHRLTLHDHIEHAHAARRQVIIDAGNCHHWTPDGPLEHLAERAERSYLVTRACYLALRRAHGAHPRPTGIIVVHEPGRALGSRDINATLGVPIVAEIPADPAIARAVDAGLLACRHPAALRRALRDAIQNRGSTR
jgi:hypothetical protein